MNRRGFFAKAIGCMAGLVALPVISADAEACDLHGKLRRLFHSGHRHRAGCGHHHACSEPCCESASPAPASEPTPMPLSPSPSDAPKSAPGAVLRPIRNLLPI